MAVGLQDVFVNQILGWVFPTNNRVYLFDGSNIVERNTDDSLPGARTEHLMTGQDLNWDLTADNGRTVKNLNKVYYKPNSNVQSYTATSFAIYDTNNNSPHRLFVGEFATTYIVPTNYQIKIYPYVANDNKGIKVTLSVTSS